uniref:Uncharacterized protein n=1 Tax=viral metagenome TaxID=1070528 RepID=A0A6C0LPQ5_9ZZZZ
MSGPTIRISDGGSFPEISASQDMGRSLDINQNDFDLNLLGNQRKIAGSVGRPASPAADLKPVDDIEFVNLDDTNVTFDVKPSGGGDNIRIMRETGPSAPIGGGGGSEPFRLGGSAPSAPTMSAQPTSAPSVTMSATTTTAAPAAKSWFSSIPGLGGATTTNPVANAAAAAAPAAAGFRSWFSGSDAPAPTPAIAQTSAVYLTPEQESGKKTEGLTILERMDRKGISGTKMSMSNTLEEINSEVARRKDSKGLEASLRFQRSMLTTVTSGMEFLNSRYDPLGLHLDGWSEQVNENIEDYDEIFEELYDKYKDKSKVAPEVRLILSLGLSAGMCHVTNTMFKSRMPGMDDILRNNPNLAREFAQAAARESVGPGFANFMSLGQPGGGRGGPPQGGGGGPSQMPPEMRQPPMREQAPPMEEQSEPEGMPSGGFMGMMGNMMGGMMPGLGAAMPAMPMAGPPQAQTVRREMRGPTGVDDILQQLNAGGRRDAEETNSIGSAYTTETMRRAGLNRRSKKTTTTQPTGSELTLNV